MIRPMKGFLEIMTDKTCKHLSNFPAVTLSVLCQLLMNLSAKVFESNLFYKSCNCSPNQVILLGRLHDVITARTEQLVLKNYIYET